MDMNMDMDDDAQRVAQETRVPSLPLQREGGEGFFSSERAKICRETKLYSVITLALGGGCTLLWCGAIWLFGDRVGSSVFASPINLSVMFLPLFVLFLAVVSTLRHLQAREQSRLFALQLDLLTGSGGDSERLGGLGRKLHTQAEALRSASQEAAGLFAEASEGVDEKIRTMKRIAEETQTESREMMEVTSALLRERLSAMGDSSRDSLDAMRAIVDNLGTKEQAMAALSREFVTLREDLGGLLSDRRVEMMSAVEGEIGKVLQGFVAFREEIARGHEQQIQHLEKSGQTVETRLEKIAADNSIRMEGFEKTIEKQHFQMLENFSTGQNSLYTRVRTVLQDITTGVDQLVNRIESRQVQIRETLSDQTQNLQEILTNFNAQNEADVRHSAQTLIEAGEKVKQRIFDQNSELSALFVRTLESQKELRDAVNDRLKQDRALLESVVVEQNDKLHDDLRRNFSHHSEWLNHLVSWLEQQNESLHQRAGDYERTFEGMLERTLGAIDSSAAAITQRLGLLERHSDKASRSLGRLGESTNSALSALETQSHRGLSLAEELNTKIGGGARLLDDTAEKLLKTGQTLSENLREQAEKIGLASEYIRSQQDKAIDGITEKALARIDRIGTAVQMQTEDINKALAQRLNEQNEILHNSMTHSLRQFDRLGEDLTSALIETNNKIFERLIEQTGMVEKSTANLVRQIAESTIALDSSIGQMQGAMQGNDSRVNDIKVMAQKQVQYFESLLERIESSSTQVRGKILSDQRQIFAALEGVQSQNVETSETIAETGQQTITNARRVAEVLASVQERLHAHLGAMSEVSNQARMHVTTLEEKVRSQVTQIGQSLEGHTQSLSVVFDPALRQIGRIVEAMDSHAERLYKGFEESLGRVHRTGALLQQQETQLQALFVSATENIDSAEKRLLDSAQTISQSANVLERQTHKIATLLDSQTQAFQSSAVDFETRLQRMGGTLLQHLQDLRNSGDEFAQRFRNTGADFSTIASDLQKVLESTVENLVHNGGRFGQTVKRLVAGLENTNQLLLDQRKQTDSSTRAFESFSTRAQNSMQSMQENFQDTERAFDRIAVKIADDLEQIATSVKDDRQGAAAIANHLERLRENLYRHCREVETLTHKAMRRFENLPENLDRHAKNILRRVDSLRDGTESLSQKIAEDVQKLKRVTDPLREEMRVMFAEGLSERQEAFMQRARSLVDDLHAKSYEISEQLLLENTADKQRYARGERNAFTRQILQSTSPTFLAEINTRREEEPKIDEPLLAYQKQFESLFQEAQRADPDNILPLAFISSDVGKLYLVLARICGREPVRFERTR